jgi:hypothetical protein
MRRERLFQTVEEIRRSRFPTLDPALVEEILSCQIQMQEDRTEAQRRTERAIANWASADAIARAGKS